MSQTIQYVPNRYMVLYRGGYDIKSKIGLDKYDRKLYPMQTYNYASVENGMLLHITTSSASSIEDIEDFLGVEHNTTYECYIKDNFKVCFDSVGRLVLYKLTTKDPIRYTKVVNKNTKEYKKWRRYAKYEKRDKYVIRGWKFKKDSDYIIVDVDLRWIFNIIPNEYKKLRINEIYNETKYEDICEMFYNLDPIDLNDSWDYSEEEKLEIVEQKRKELERKMKAQEELDRLKSLDGHCDICGAPYADYVDDPYDYEMHGTHNKRWLCSKCYDDICGDI